MAIRTLRLGGFRNLADIELEFHLDANYLFGPNAAGKTNVLEAIHYLAIGRSFRRARDRDILGFDREVLSVTGRDDQGQEAEIRADGVSKRVTLGGREVERLSDFLGWLPVVVLLLDDIQLVRGAPSVRRSYLDLAIAKADREYIGVAAGYRRALVQRNRALQQNAPDDALRPWGEALVRAGVALVEFRHRYVDTMLEAAGEYYGQLSGRPGKFSHRVSVAAGTGAAEVFRRKLQETRAREREVGHSLVGPHRDDIKVESGERELRRFGSVGEQRLAAVALRLAEADLLLKVTGRKPVFLLDEVASELDDERGPRLLGLVAERGQVVYAAARRFDAAGKEFRVEAGQVRQAG